MGEKARGRRRDKTGTVMMFNTSYHVVFLPYVYRVWQKSFSKAAWGEFTQPGKSLFATLYLIRPEIEDICFELTWFCKRFITV